MNESGRYTLGACLLGHDLSITLLKPDGSPLIVAEEERYSRRKNGNFVLSPAFCGKVLDEAGVAPASIASLSIANIP